MTTIPAELQGITLIAAQSARQLVSTAYYNTAGRQVSSCCQGIVIRRRVYSDGSTDYTKFVR